MNHNQSNDSLHESSLLSYIGQFRVHQKFVQGHLKGTLNDEQPLLPDFFPPLSHWTSHEKDLFFHGLTVYSRFRPDLIAESIKTKTAFDVRLYLDILQTVSARLPLVETHGSFRNSLEPAMEVSSTWIQKEEQVAAALNQLDFCTWTPGSADGETKNRCVCSPQSLVDYSGPSSVDQASHTELKKSYFSHLDCTCLMTLEKIVREAQLCEVDSAAIPLSPDSSKQSVTHTDPFSEKSLADLDSPESLAMASKTPKSDSSRSEAQYRLMKRLYMRRKRAQSSGKSINISEAIRLPPGRQSRDRKPSKYEPRSMRLKKLFLEIGVDSQLASKNNLDFFHLSSLAQLMRVYGLPNDLKRPSFEVSISGNTIQLLVVILKEFVSEVVCASLISKEQEVSLKGASKVWKYDHKEITIRNIREALKSIGISHSNFNLKDYITELVGERNDDILSPHSSIDTEMVTNNGDGSGDEDNRDNDEEEPSNASDASEQSVEPSQAPTEFWLPQSLRRCLLPMHFRVSENEGSVLPEIDEIGCQREIQEEEELDSRDSMASKEFEAGLWGS